MMPWLLRALLFGVLMSAGALLMERALRATRLPLRAIWISALLLSVLVPLFALVQPQLWPESIRPVVTVAQSHSGQADVVRDASPAMTLAIAWFLLVVLCVTRYAWGWTSLWRARREWSRADFSMHPLAGLAATNRSKSHAAVGKTKPNQKPVLTARAQTRSPSFPSRHFRLGK